MVGGQFLLTAEGIEKLPGCRLCGLLHDLYGIPQVEGPGRAGSHACGAFGPIRTQVAFDGGLLFPAADVCGRHMDGAKGADDHAEPACNAEPRVNGCEGLGAVGCAGGTDLNAGSVLALPALGGKLDPVHLHHPIAGLESLTGQDRPQYRACPSVRCGAGQLTGVATHATLGVNKDKRTFYGHDIHLLRKGILPSIIKKTGICLPVFVTGATRHSPRFLKNMRDSDGVSPLSKFRFVMDEISIFISNLPQIVNQELRN